MKWYENENILENEKIIQFMASAKQIKKDLQDFIVGFIYVSHHHIFMTIYESWYGSSEKSYVSFKNSHLV